MKCAHIFLFTFLLATLPDNSLCEEQYYEELSEMFSPEIVGEGRTFVHNTVKRLAIILPAVFFKMGIAFSLLLLVTVVAVNNGFIGFLLLIVGVSSVLARLQEAKRILPVPIPAAHALPLPLALGHHQHFLDRSDNENDLKEIKSNPSTISPYSYATNPTYFQTSNTEGNYIYNNGKYYVTNQ